MKVQLTALLALLTACSPKTNDNTHSSAASNDVITLERTACYGTCPVYRLMIFRNDGLVVFHGTEHTAVKGVVKSSLSNSKTEQLFQLFENIKFHTLKGDFVSDKTNCPINITDAAVAITTLQTQDHYTSILHYQGCTGSDIVEELSDLEDTIDDIVETKRWTAQ